MLRTRALWALPLAACTHAAPGGGDPSDRAPSSAPAASPAAAGAKKGIAIGHVLTHDAKLTLLALGGDVRVTVRSLDGALVAEALTLDELRARDPEAHRVCSAAVAQRGTFLDATLYPDDVRTPGALTGGTR